MTVCSFSMVAFISPSCPQYLILSSIFSLRAFSYFWSNFQFKMASSQSLALVDSSRWQLSFRAEFSLTSSMTLLLYSSMMQFSYSTCLLQSQLLPSLNSKDLQLGIYRKLCRAPLEIDECFYWRMEDYTQAPQVGFADLPYSSNRYTMQPFCPGHITRFCRTEPSPASFKLTIVVPTYATQSSPTATMQTPTRCSKFENTEGCGAVKVMSSLSGNFLVGSFSGISYTYLT